MTFAGFLPNLLDDHADTAAFLWRVRAHLCHSRTHTLADLDRLDDRLDAHLDALVLAGAHTPKTPFVATFVAVRTGAFDRVAAQVRSGAHDPRDFCAALGWAPHRECLAALDSDPEVARHRVSATRWHDLTRDPARDLPFGNDVASFEQTLRRASAVDVAAHLRRAVVAGQGRIAIEAAVAWGDPATLPWLVECTASAPLARLAGWGLATLTGVDLVASQLVGDAPAGFSAGPTDNPLEHIVTQDPDARLPWPAHHRVVAWWSEYAARVPAGVALLFGRARDRECLAHARRDAPQWVRALARARLDAHDAPKTLPVDAPAFRQKRVFQEQSDGHVATR